MKKGRLDRADSPFLLALELSRLFLVQEVCPNEATEAYLEGIDVLNFKFNGYLTVPEETFPGTWIWPRAPRDLAPPPSLHLVPASIIW